MFFGCLPCCGGCPDCPRYLLYGGFAFSCSYRLEWGSITAGSYTIPAVDVTASQADTTNGGTPGTASWQAVQYPDGTTGTQTLSLLVNLDIGDDSYNGFTLSATANIAGAFSPVRQRVFQFRLFPCGATYSTGDETAMSFYIDKAPTSSTNSLITGRTLDVYANKGTQQYNYSSTDDTFLQSVSESNPIEFSYAEGLRQDCTFTPADGVYAVQLVSSYTAPTSKTSDWSGYTVSSAFARETFTVSLLTGTKADGTIEPLFPWGITLPDGLA